MGRLWFWFKVKYAEWVLWRSIRRLRRKARFYVAESALERHGWKRED